MGFMSQPLLVYALCRPHAGARESSCYSDRVEQKLSFVGVTEGDAIEKAVGYFPAVASGLVNSQNADV